MVMTYSVDTRRHCEVGLRACEIFVHNPQEQRCREKVRKNCCMLSILPVPSCVNSFWLGVIPTSFFIFIVIFPCHSMAKTSMIGHEADNV